MYKRQALGVAAAAGAAAANSAVAVISKSRSASARTAWNTCLLYTSDAADERSSVDLGGRRIIQKKKIHIDERHTTTSIHTESQNNVTQNDIETQQKQRDGTT